MLPELKSNLVPAERKDWRLVFFVFSFFGWSFVDDFYFGWSQEDCDRRLGLVKLARLRQSCFY